MLNLVQSAAFLMILFLVVPQPASGQGSNAPDPATIPESYRDKQMPEGWWTDPAVIAEGKRIYEGKANARVICAACHGKYGKPKLRGARDLTDASYVNRFTDGYWFWRISEGVPDTAMKGWKGALSEEAIWKVIAYIHTFSHEGQPAEHIR